MPFVHRQHPRKPIYWASELLSKHDAMAVERANAEFSHPPCFVTELLDDSNTLLG